MRKGKVYIVGAGPGSPDLLTVKAARLLKKADVVIYDRLVNPEVLKLVRGSARKIYAGKRTGEGHLQGRINDLMLSEAEGGRSVVRLKGGDPMIFGRGGEEAEFLMRSGVLFEIVPGISSAFAAPDLAGIPLTHRKLSSSIMIATGQRAGSKQEEGVNWRSAAHAADTLIILMGAATFPEIARRLIDGGMRENTPVAVIERAATPEQKTRVFRLGAMMKRDPSNTIHPPCVIVIGRVASLARKLDWLRVAGKTTLEAPRRNRPRRNDDLHGSPA